jgi:hypothetical protein
MPAGGSFPGKYPVVLKRISSFVPGNGRAPDERTATIVD